MAEQVRPSPLPNYQIVVSPEPVSAPEVASNYYDPGTPALHGIRQFIREKRLDWVQNLSNRRQAAADARSEIVTAVLEGRFPDIPTNRPSERRLALRASRQRETIIGKSYARKRLQTPYGHEDHAGKPLNDESDLGTPEQELRLRAERYGGARVRSEHKAARRYKWAGVAKDRAEFRMTRVIMGEDIPSRVLDARAAGAKDLVRKRRAQVEELWPTTMHPAQRHPLAYVGATGRVEDIDLFDDDNDYPTRRVKHIGRHTTL